MNVVSLCWQMFILAVGVSETAVYICTYRHELGKDSHRNIDRVWYCFFFKLLKVA